MRATNCWRFEAPSDEQWSTTLYTDGAVWTIKDMLAHQIRPNASFNTTGAIFWRAAPAHRKIFRSTRSQCRGRVDGRSDGCRFVGRFARHAPASIDLVAMIVRLILRQGRHPFFGLMMIEDMFKLIYRHNMMHARDLRRVLRPPLWEEPSHDTQRTQTSIARSSDSHARTFAGSDGQLQPADWGKVVQSSERLDGETGVAASGDVRIRLNRHGQSHRQRTAHRAR
jgi:hypothetical protein